MPVRIPIALVLLAILAVAGVQAATYSRITASTMDSNGNTYVTGWRVTYESGSQYVCDIVTIKYDKSGVMQWAHRYPDNPALGAISDSEGWGIAADSLGNVYVAGHSGLAANVDSVLIKYPAGYKQGDSPEWVKFYAGAANRHDQFWSMTVDPDGYIYVTGYTGVQHGAGINSDIVTMKFDSAGTMVWPAPAIYNGPANRSDTGIAVAVHPVTRNVYVAGRSQNATADDLIVIMYNSSGTEQWVGRYDGPAAGGDRATSLALDADGNAYVTGYSVGPGSLDIVTLKYGAGGNPVWAARYDGPAGGADQPAPPVLSASFGSVGSYLQHNQGIIVTPELVAPAPAVDYLMGKVQALDLNQGLKTSLLVKLQACLASLLAPNAAERQNAANVLAAFVNELAALNRSRQISGADFTELARAADITGKSILGIPTTAVYVGGQSAGVDTASDFVLLKYNAADGSPMWNLPGQPGTTSANPGNPANIALRFSSPGSFNDWGWAIALDRDGNLFLAGPSNLPPPGGGAPMPDFFTLKYSVNTFQPAVLAQHRFEYTAGRRDVPSGFATWREPVTGRQLIFRDPATGKDYVPITGLADLNVSADRLYQYATIMYDGSLQLQWSQFAFDVIIP